MTFTWVSTSEAAALVGVEVSVVKKRCSHGELECRRTKRGHNSGAFEVLLSSLPISAQAKFFAEHPELAKTAEAQSVDEFTHAPAAIQRRAQQRLETVLSYREAMRQRPENEAKVATAERWFAAYRVAHFRIDINVSVKSVKRWSRAYSALGIVGLLDRNDGHQRRGKITIPPDAANFFLARYLDKDEPPTIAGAIFETRLAEAEFGWKLPAGDGPFYRLAHKVPAIQRRGRREDADKLENLLPYVVRSSDVPGRTLQSDHHICDRFVNCEGEKCGEACRLHESCGEGPCKGKCSKPHRPWFTPMFDVGSRMIVSYAIGLEVPNSQTILRPFADALRRYGLWKYVYIDNGKDFRKAFEAWGQLHDDFLSRLLALGITAKFALPYNAQAKAIERMFRTFVLRFWTGHEGYTGPLGKRSEHVQQMEKRPELLPAWSEFRRELDAEIEVYNNTVHRGRGMKGRSPLAVFASEKLEMAKPDAMAFALVFAERVPRMLTRNGIAIGEDYYRLGDIDQQFRHQGHWVDVLIDHDDVRSVILITGCDKHKRESCGCDARGTLIGEATLEGFANHDTADAVTKAHIERVAHERKEIKKRINAGDWRATAQLHHFKKHRVAILQKLAAKYREENRELLAQAVGSATATTIVPRYSKLARDLEVQRAASSHGLSAADLELARSVEGPSDLDLAEMARSARLHVKRHPFGAGEIEDPEEMVQRVGANVDAQLAEIDRERRIAERVRRGFCASLECSSPIYREDFCHEHWTEVFGE